MWPPCWSAAGKRSPTLTPCVNRSTCYGRSPRRRRSGAPSWRQLRRLGRRSIGSRRPELECRATRLEGCRDDAGRRPGGVERRLDMVVWHSERSRRAHLQEDVRLSPIAADFTAWLRLPDLDDDTAALNRRSRATDCCNSPAGSSMADDSRRLRLLTTGRDHHAPKRIHPDRASRSTSGPRRRSTAHLKDRGEGSAHLPAHRPEPAAAPTGASQATAPPAACAPAAAARACTG
jgi:hypothetical protein